MAVSAAFGHVLRHVKHQTESTASNQWDRWRCPRKAKSPLIDEAVKSGYMMLVAVLVAHTALATVVANGEK